MAHIVQLGTLRGVTIDLHRMEDTNGGRTRTRVKAGTRTADVEFTIDTSRLLYIAMKAAGSKSGKAGALHGALKARVVRKSDVKVGSIEITLQESR